MGAELTPEEAQKRIEAQQAEINQLKADKSQLETDKQALSDLNKTLQANLATAEEMIDELSKENANRSTGSALPIVTVAGKEYQITAGKIIRMIDSNRVVITAEELAKDQELLKELVSEKSGILEPVK